MRIFNKNIKVILDEIQEFIGKLSLSNPLLRKQLSSLFILLVPIPISRDISSFKKTPTQLVLDTIPIFSFLLSRGKLNTQAGMEGIRFEMPLMRTVRESLILISHVKIPERSERIFEQTLIRLCDFANFFYEKTVVNEVISLIKDASSLIGLLLAGEKKQRNVKPDDLKLAFQSLRSILFKIPSIDWVVIKKLSMLQRGSKFNWLIQEPTISAIQEKRLRTYFYQQLSNNSHKSLLNRGEDLYSASDFLFKSFIDFLHIQKWKLKQNNGSESPIEYAFAEFRKICTHSLGINVSKGLSSITEVTPTPEAYEVLRILKKRVTEYIQLTNNSQSFLSEKYEYSTFIEQQRSLIIFLSIIKSCKQTKKEIGRNDILLGFIEWINLIFEDSNNKSTLQLN